MLKAINKICLLLIAVLISSTALYSQDDVKMEKASDVPAGIQMEDGMLYGKDYDNSMTVMEFSDLMNNAGEYEGKTVLVRGNVTEVCQKMGCWMTMSDGANSARVVTLHNFFVPKDVTGTNAVVIGTFKQVEISEEMAKHYLEESNNPSMKPEDIKGPQKGFEIEAEGIKILSVAPVGDSPVDPTQK